MKQSRAERESGKTVYTAKAFIHQNIDRLITEAIDILPDPRKCLNQQIKAVNFRGSWMRDNFDPKHPINVQLRFKLGHPIIRDGMEVASFRWEYQEAVWFERQRDGAPKTDIDGDAASPDTDVVDVSPAAKKLAEEAGIDLQDVIEANNDVDKITVPMVRSMIETRDAGEAAMAG